MFMFTFFAGNIAWAVAGSMIRWGYSGTIVSQEFAMMVDGEAISITDGLYMPKTGTFLKIWLIIMYILLGIVGCCSLFVVSCMKSKPDESKTKEIPTGGNYPAYKKTAFNVDHNTSANKSKSFVHTESSAGSDSKNSQRSSTFKFQSKNKNKS